MTQTGTYRKRIVQRRHKLALINDKAANPHPIC